MLQTIGIGTDEMDRRPIAEASNDEPIAHLLTLHMQIHEKTAWMLRSLIS